MTHSLVPINPARTALGRTGPAIPTRHHLDFQLDHALARDAVHTTLNVPSLLAALRERHLHPIALHSAAPDRTTYLRRPDLGRTLAEESAAALQPNPNDVTLILADGLSAQAIERHALPLLDALLPLLTDWRLGPVPVVTQARVAIGDPIGTLLHSTLTVLLIGERPGLSAPDSLGVYLTWHPRPGRTDAERNCISNIRHEGLGYLDAARRIHAYMQGARLLNQTGIALKEAATPAIAATANDPP